MKGFEECVREETAHLATLKVVTNEKVEALGEILTIIC
jgi:hypothetical protein